MKESRRLHLHFALLAVALAGQACTPKSQPETPPPKAISGNPTPISGNPATEISGNSAPPDTLNVRGFIYPRTGKMSADFLPRPGNL